jgi:DNA polymerase-1
MQDRIIIIDGNSLINRAYYAMQRPMITREGIYTQGVYGFLNMLNKIHQDYPSGYIAVAFDRKAPTFRHEEYAEYKAGRKKMPPELAMQLPVLKEVLQAMNIKMLELDGFEADDIIGTVAREAEEKGLLPLIISGDKDELQLASEKTKVLITKKGISEFEIYDRQAMIDKYGFPPEHFVDYKGLMGDSSDNIPGLPGVGEKTAGKLIQEYGTVENLIARSSEIKQDRIRNIIEENAHLALMSKRLATIHLNTPIEVDFDEFRNEEPDFNQLINIYSKLEFNSFLKKMKSASHGVMNPPEILKDSIGKRVKTLKSSQEVGEAIQKTGVVLKVFTDNNHVGPTRIDGIVFASGGHCFFIDGNSPDRIRTFGEEIIKRRIPLSGHNLVRDYFALFRLLGDSGIFLPEGANSYFTTAFDTAVVQYVLDPSKSNYDLKVLMAEYYHEEFQSEEDFLKEAGQMNLFGEDNQKIMEYGWAWCRAVDNLKILFEERLKDQEGEKLAFDLELPLIEVMAAMENHGFTTDREELRIIGEEIEGRLKALSGRIIGLAGEEFNLNSPAQLGPILFEKLGLPAGKKTKTGYSTSAEVLERLTEEHEIIPAILEYRTLSKLKSTYIEGLMPLIGEDGKIHPHFQQTVAATGRISCTEPNLQNIPIKQDYGRKLRKAFRSSDDNHTLVSADYSQIELRLLAHLSEDPLLLEAFRREDDIHTITASRVFGVPEEEVTPLQRSNAKAVNFGVIYGMSGFGLSTELNIPRKEAEKYIHEYFEKYTKVREYMDRAVAEAKEKGYVTTVMNRRRNIPEIKGTSFVVRQLGERLAMNSPLQGSAADIIKLAMLRVYRKIIGDRMKSRLILQVHDELIIEAHQEELEQIKFLIEDAMVHAMSLKVPLAVEVKWAQDWYSLK